MHVGLKKRGFMSSWFGSSEEGPAKGEGENFSTQFVDFLMKQSERSAAEARQAEQAAEQQRSQQRAAEQAAEQQRTAAQGNGRPLAGPRRAADAPGSATSARPGATRESAAAQEQRQPNGPMEDQRAGAQLRPAKTSAAAGNNAPPPQPSERPAAAAPQTLAEVQPDKPQPVQGGGLAGIDIDMPLPEDGSLVERFYRR